MARSFSLDDLPPIQNCWFCKTRQAPSYYDALVVNMHGMVKQGDTSNYVLVKTKAVSFQKTKIHVPRCAQCKKAHLVATLVYVIACAGCIAVAYFAMASYYERSGWFVEMSGWPFYLATAVLAVILCLSALFIQKLALPSSVKPKSTKLEYPPIRELAARGWKFGDRPPGTI